MVSDELHRELQELYRIHDQMIAEARETEQAEQVHYKVSETPPRQQVSTFDETLVDDIAQFVARGRLRRLPQLIWKCRAPNSPWPLNNLRKVVLLPVNNLT